MAPASIRASAATVWGSGTLRVSSRDVGCTSSGLGASSTSMGSATKTGPMGGVEAIFTARRSTRSTEPASTTRVDHLVTGRAMATRSHAICASMAS